MTQDTPKAQKIALIGPVSPFRGGVARHTTQIAQALQVRPNVDLRVISFSRLYPRFLYPGGDPKDPDLSADPALKTEYCLDAVNPLSWFSTAESLRAWEPDTVIIPAWTFFVAPCLGLIAGRLRRASIRVVSMVHNDADHESSSLKRAFNNYQLRSADAFVSHSGALAESLRKVNAGARSTVLPMPIFDDYPVSIDPPIRRAELELLFFGFVRPYKGLDTAIEALALSGRTDVRLTVAGEFWGGRETYDQLIAAHGVKDRIEIFDRYVSDLEAAGLFARSDAVLLPYRTVTGSAVVALAYHYLKPVVVTNLPGFTDVVQEGRTGWIIPPDDPNALAELIATGLSAKECQSMEPAITDFVASQSWSALVDAILTN